MKIGIIGGGASGLMAAITAAHHGADVTIIEKKDRVGKKILATGNGRCNFTNKNITDTDYRSQSPHVYNDYFSQFNENDVISLFESWGMMWKDRNGYCYPRSDQASTILDILRQKCNTEGVRVLTDHIPSNIVKNKKNFIVSFNISPEGIKKLYFDKVILACGSLAGEKKHAELNGYTYAKHFGHTIIPVVPALVQVRAAGEYFKRIAGVRCDAKVTLYIDEIETAREFGELQLTDYGISGIPVFQLSRYVSYGAYYGNKLEAVIDFVPDYSFDLWKSILHDKWKNMRHTLTLEDFFVGTLNKKLIMMFLTNDKYSPQMKLSSLRFNDILNIAASMKSWKISLIDTKPYENAQVCAGGVSMDEITASMESRMVPGLYFCGELLDVDGRCGGYNLQWAWTSGYLAGKYSAISEK